MTSKKNDQTEPLTRINLNHSHSATSSSSAKSAAKSSVSESDKAMKQAQSATADPSVKKSQTTEKRQIADQIMTYSRFDDAPARIKYLQSLIAALPENNSHKLATSDQLMHHSSIINKLAYVFPNTGADDIQELVKLLKEQNPQLFTSDRLTIGTDSDLTTVQYKFTRAFHLLGRTDSKDLFKVVITWKLLDPSVNVVTYSRKRDVAQQLDRLNRYIDGQTKSAPSISAIQKRMAEVIAVIDFLEDLNSGDDAKVKELTRYRSDFVDGRQLIQPLRQQGTYETVASIKQRAFGPQQADKPDDEFDDFIADIRNLSDNYVKDGGVFSRERPRNRRETINALLNGDLVTKPVLKTYQHKYDSLKKQLEDAKSAEQSTNQSEDSAIELVLHQQQAIIDDISNQIQEALDHLAKTTISPVKLNTVLRQKSDR